MLSLHPCHPSSTPIRLAHHHIRGRPRPLDSTVQDHSPHTPPRALAGLSHSHGRLARTNTDIDADAGMDGRRFPRTFNSKHAHTRRQLETQTSSPSAHPLVHSSTRPHIHSSTGNTGNGKTHTPPLSPATPLPARFPRPDSPASLGVARLPRSWTPTNAGVSLPHSHTPRP